MKKVLKIIGIIFGVIVLLIIGLLVFIFIKNKIDSNKALLPDNYYEEFKSNSELEMRYSQLGGYEVSNTSFDSCDKSAGTISVWYPSQMEQENTVWPMIIVVNGSNIRVRNYIPFFERLASWGFIVVGNDDPQTGTGESASVTLDKMLSLPSDSVLYGKIDVNNIGVIGYSQGGAGAINAVTRYENGSYYKALFTGSASYALLAKNMGWEYDISKVHIPYLMTAGTGASDDSGHYGDDEFAGVAPLFSLEENYNGMPDDVFKVRGRITGAEHMAMQVLSDGYMTAWMLYNLRGDEEAGKVFIGENAEIMQNQGWQDVEKNQ